MTTISTADLSWCQTEWISKLPRALRIIGLLFFCFLFWVAYNTLILALWHKIFILYLTLLSAPYLLVEFENIYTYMSIYVYKDMYIVYVYIFEMFLLPTHGSISFLHLVWLGLSV